MLVLYEQQPGLRLDLRVVQRTLRERAHGAHRVDNALPGRVALTTGTLHRRVHHKGSQVMPLTDDQRE